MTILSHILKPYLNGKHRAALEKEDARQMEVARQRAVEIERRVAYLEAQARLAVELHNLQGVDDGDSAGAK